MQYHWNRTMEQNKILIVEDDTELVDSLRLNLSTKGFAVEFAGDGLQGLALALAGDFSVIVLDVNLPGLDGLEVCRKIREKNRSVPIMILTCQGEDLDKVMGFELGADDYVTKPFRMSELLARLRALIRRSQVSDQDRENEAPAEFIKFDELSIDVPNRHVTLSSEAVDLTPREFSLLVFLASQPGHPFSREEILKSVWETSNLGYAHAVTSTTKRLRSKLDKDADPPKYIQTVWGVGYRFGPPPS